MSPYLLLCVLTASYESAEQQEETTPVRRTKLTPNTLQIDTTKTDLIRSTLPETGNDVRIYLHRDPITGGHSRRPWRRVVLQAAHV